MRKYCSDCGIEINETDKYCKRCGRKTTPVSIGNIHKLEIIDKSEKGDGIAKIKNFIIFVPNVDIGDLVKIKIVQVMSNCAKGIKVENTAKTFLFTKGPLIPTSFTSNHDEGLIS